jgi:signal transduction histidine kinase
MTEATFTQFAALLAAALLIPSFIFLAYGVNHRNMPFWWTAAFAYLLIFCGSTLAALRNVLPDLAVSLLANALIGYGYFLCLRAVRKVKSCWRFRSAEAILTGVYFVGLVLVVSLANIYPARVALISAFISAISLAAFLVTLRCGTRVSRIGDTALLVFAVGNTLFSSLRGLSALVDGNAHMMTFAFWDQAFFIWSIAAVFCFAIGLFLNGTALISEETRQALEREQRLTVALTEALEGQRNLRKLILHELKRPINALATTVDLSRRGKKGMSADEVTRVDQLIRVATHYLREIGDYEDIHALFDSPTRTGVNVYNLIEDIRNKWGVPVVASPEADETRVAVDLLLFDIAIGNLIENAQKFGEGRAEVRVGLAPGDGSVIFDVIDNGPGIPPREADRVFRQFYKIEADRTATSGGCGLGLYVTRRIAEAHGGGCYVLSQTPSTLRLSVPRATAEGGANA